MQRIVMCILLIFLEICSCTSVPVQQSNKELLTLPYDKFDQTPHQGWRRLGENLNYLAAAQLIDQYINCNSSWLQDWQLTILNWHAGQMYAFYGDTVMARKRFLVSIDNNESKETLVLWNDYVKATIAFLDKDLTALKKYRKRIAHGSKIDGHIANLDVVDGLIKCFNETYVVAYSRCREEN